jgi:hypothetical protein
LGPISGFLGLAVSFVAVSLTAVVFPFVKPDVFESSPIAWRVGGVPVITIMGLVSSVFVLYVVQRLLRDSSFTVNLTFSNLGTLVVIAVALLWFYGFRAYRKARGVDVDRRFREIPIE